MYNELTSYIEMWEVIINAMRELSHSMKEKLSIRQYESYFKSIGAHFGIVRDEKGNSLGEKFILKKEENTVIYADMERKCAIALIDGEEVYHKALHDNTLQAIHHMDLKREMKHSELSGMNQEVS